MATRFNQFYAAELARLRAHSLDFAQANPAIAPMLGAVSTDPDVERLLEGVAFLNGLTRQKLDDEFPEIVQELASILVPQFLRPLPAASLVAFTPKTPLSETAIIRAGTEIGAAPVDGVSCTFRTTADVTAHLVALDNATLDNLPDGGQALRLQLTADEDDTGTLLPSSLRFFLGQEPSVAANILMLLGTQLKAVHLLDAQGHSLVLSPKVFFPGFDEALFPYPDNAFPAFGWFQELLFFPQKFLFFQVQDLAGGRGIIKGTKFRLDFIFNKSAVQIPPVTARDFVLNVAPVVKAYRERFPGVQISVTVGDSQSITQRILNYEGDIGLVLNEISDPNIHCLPYRAQQLVIFAATGHPLANRDEIHLNDLNGQEFVMREQGSGTRKAFEDALSACNITIKTSLEMRSREAVREAVVQGLGLGVVADTAYQPGPGLVQLNVRGFTAQTFTRLICRTERKNSPFIANFLETARAVCLK